MIDDTTLQVDGSTGRWLVLLNSIAADTRLWDGVVDRLKDRVHILRHDWPGHGSNAQSPVPAYDLAGYARHLLDTMQQRGIAHAHLAGVSMGAMVSAEAALLAPETVTGVSWFNAMAQAGQDYAAFWQSRAEQVAGEGMTSIVEATLDRWLTPEAGDDLRQHARRMILNTSPAGFCAAARALSGLALLDRLPRLQAQVSFVAGARDAAAPPGMVEKAARLTPGATFRCLEGVAHLSPLEAPQAVAEQILTDMGLEDGAR